MLESKYYKRVYAFSSFFFLKLNAMNGENRKCQRASIIARNSQYEEISQSMGLYAVYLHAKYVY